MSPLGPRRNESNVDMFPLSLMSPEMKVVVVFC